MTLSSWSPSKGGRNYINLRRIVYENQKLSNLMSKTCIKMGRFFLLDSKRIVRCDVKRCFVELDIRVWILPLQSLSLTVTEELPETDIHFNAILSLEVSHKGHSLLCTILFFQHFFLWGSFHKIMASSVHINRTCLQET